MKWVLSSRLTRDPALMTSASSWWCSGVGTTASWLSNFIYAQLRWAEGNHHRASKTLLQLDSSMGGLTQSEGGWGTQGTRAGEGFTLLRDCFSVGWLLIFHIRCYPPSSLFPIPTCWLVSKMHRFYFIFVNLPAKFQRGNELNHPELRGISEQASRSGRQGSCWHCGFYIWVSMPGHLPKVIQRHWSFLADFLWYHQPPDNDTETSY